LLYAPAIAIARLVRFAVRLVRPGGGSALPGLVLSKIAPRLLAKTLQSFPKGLVVVTGSAGKSTTTKMVVAVLRSHGLEVFTNPSTANISQGFFSSIVEQSNLAGRIEGDVAVLEMDEGHAAEITREVSPKVVTLLNVLEDQLDRFVDPSLVRSKLVEVAARATDHLVINADDQNLLLLDQECVNTEAMRTYIAIEQSVSSASLHGLGYAPTHREKLTAPQAQAKIIDLDERLCTMLIGDQRAEIKLPNRGLHFALDALAAIQTSLVFLGSNFNLAKALETLNNLPPVFARGEVVEVQGQKIEFILVQNPTSFQLNLDNLASSPERLFVAIGRDAHDPSWLWTVDYSKIKHVDVVSGFNAAEMGLRFAYDEIQVDFVDDDLGVAFDRFLALPQPEGSVKTVIFSADAMRRLRRMLGFISPDEVDR
jgi:UDP-N-acetylmuramyl tripeptide synthase